MGLGVGLVNIPLSPKMNHFMRADWNLAAVSEAWRPRRLSSCIGLELVLYTVHCELEINK
jgi:hypothetical protein